MNVDVNITVAHDGNVLTYRICGKIVARVSHTGVSESFVRTANLQEKWFYNGNHKHNATRYAENICEIEFRRMFGVDYVWPEQKGGGDE